MKNPLHITSFAILSLLLTQCSDYRATEKNRPVVKLPKVQALAEIEYADAYRHILAARKLEKRLPQQAFTRYLAAAKVAYDSQSEALLPLYNHAVGQIADLVVAHQDTGFPIRQHASTADEFEAKNMDDIIPVDCIRQKGWRTYVRQKGVGAPVVVVQEKESITGIDKAFATPRGQSYPATAVIEFPKGQTPILKFYNSTKRDKVVFWSAPRKLAHDLTAPLAVSVQEAYSSDGYSLLSWLGVFTPMNFVDKVGLYMTSPFDPNKIPVVLVHGLNSNPVTWHRAINELQADPIIRGRYQFIAFYYPTGLPLHISGAKLKLEINKLNALYRKEGMRKNGEQMVLIGHSLGGILTSTQIRRFEKDLLSRAFKKPLDNVKVNGSALDAYRYLIRGPKPYFIKRAIFISTPHGGSRDADIYLLRLLSSLVEVPKNMMLLKVPETATALTDFGRSIFGAEKPENSLSLLQSQSRKLALLRESPVYRHIKYHSIMGDRGRGDTPDSSDGVVAYESSHLEGAESEKIVPSRHSAQNNAQGIQEIRRILRLHLRSN